MSKFVVLLAVYAAAVASLLLWESRKQEPSAGPTADPFLDPGNSSDEEVRRLMAEARSLLRDEVKDTLKNVDWRLARIDALRASMEEGLEATQRTATEAGSANYGKLEAMQEEVAGFADAARALAAIQTTLREIEARLEAVEERPAQIIREAAGPGTAPGTAPGAGPGPKPPVAVPTNPGARLPEPVRKDPEVVKAETEKALKDILSNELSVVFAAIEKVREHRVLAAVPRLLEILATFPEEFGRAAAAAALGSMKIADAVPALAEAIVDKSGMVAQQANKSVRQITGFDSQMSSSARVRERRTVRTRVKEWWRSHEQEVRKRLGQPAKSADRGG